MLPTLIWRRFKVRISPPVHDSLRGSWVELPHAPQATGSRFKVKRLADGQDLVTSAQQVVTQASAGGIPLAAAAINAWWIQ